MAKPFSAQKRIHWKEIVLKQRQSGLSIASWCRRNDIKDHVFYYWQNKLFPKETLERSSFTEIPLENKISASIPNESNVLIDYQRIRFQFDSKSDISKLKQFLNELKEVMC